MTKIIEKSICEIDKYGTKRWFNLKYELHRENDKPAIETCNEWNNGTKQWFLNGKHHREKGPAVECLFDGHKEWYWHGERIDVNSQEEFEEKLPYLIIKDIHEQ